MSYLSGEENNIKVDVHKIPDELKRNYESALVYFYGALHLASTKGNKKKVKEWIDKAIQNGINFHNIYAKELEDAIKSGIFGDDSGIPRVSS